MLNGGYLTDYSVMLGIVCEWEKLERTANI